jgi:hypothetical protein
MPPGAKAPPTTHLRITHDAVLVVVPAGVRLKVQLLEQRPVVGNCISVRGL